jgi:hypothetical protein
MKQINAITATTSNSSDKDVNKMNSNKNKNFHKYNSNKNFHSDNRYSNEKKSRYSNVRCQFCDRTGHTLRNCFAFKRQFPNSRFNANTQHNNKRYSVSQRRFNNHHYSSTSSCARSRGTHKNSDICNTSNLHICYHDTNPPLPPSDNSSCVRCSTAQNSKASASNCPNICGGH